MPTTAAALHPFSAQNVKLPQLNSIIAPIGAPPIVVGRLFVCGFAEVLTSMHPCRSRLRAMPVDTTRKLSLTLSGVAPTITDDVNITAVKANITAKPRYTLW